MLIRGYHGNIASWPECGTLSRSGSNVYAGGTIIAQFTVAAGTDGAKRAELLLVTLRRAIALREAEFSVAEWESRFDAARPEMVDCTGAAVSRR